MTTFLLIISYIAFIGLGIPDSLFGAVWPAIYPEFGIPISLATLVTVIISSGTIFSSLFAARLINRFGTGKITAVSTTATALCYVFLAKFLGWYVTGRQFCLPVITFMQRYLPLHLRHKCRTLR